MAQVPKIDENVKNCDFSKVENTYQGTNICYSTHNLGCLKDFKGSVSTRTVMLTPK